MKELPWWFSTKESTCNAGDVGLIPGLGGSPGGGNGNPPQCACLKNPTDRGAWWATVHRVAQSQTRLSDWAQYIWKVEFVETVIKDIGKLDCWIKNLQKFLMVINVILQRVVFGDQLILISNSSNFWQPINPKVSQSQAAGQPTYWLDRLIYVLRSLVVSKSRGDKRNKQRHKKKKNTVMTCHE